MIKAEEDLALEIRDAAYAVISNRGKLVDTQLVETNHSLSEMIGQLHRITENATKIIAAANELTGRYAETLGEWALREEEHVYRLQKAVKAAGK